MSPSRTALVTFLGLQLGIFACASHAQDVPRRSPSQDVSASDLRQRQGLRPDEHLLFNGWGVTPAGKQVQISDMPLKMVVAPDGKTLVAISAGYNKHGLSVIDISTRQVKQFLQVPEAFNGLAFDK